MNVEHELRHQLQGVLVRYDAQRADEMVRIATQAALLDARRRWHAPLAAAAAVVVVGSGAAALAATDSGGSSGTPARSAPSTAATGHETSAPSAPATSQSTSACAAVIVSGKPYKVVAIDRRGRADLDLHRLQSGASVVFKVVRCPTP